MPKSVSVNRKRNKKAKASKMRWQKIKQLNYSVDQYHNEQFQGIFTDLSETRNDLPETFGRTNCSVEINKGTSFKEIHDNVDGNPL
ncbi:hypothetical protein RN001_001272 [Aquatica leii]|uniref:Uncharacterized protein n=1 Tax=Aquatica leii TaxID=1421715 RepID=A0AAN7SCN0_9COLE|nr:hypothetical protein RN001_001272 [Aquatica leii]